MGERKGQNKYYPPDFDYKVHKSLAGYHGQHPLRERARKIDQGILVIRFEMPYNIWCEGCNAHIGMGVRYNAEKSKIGMYYTTPVLKFRMKCHLCNNHFEIKTDPGNHDYVIISGARRKEQRWDPHENEQIVPEDRATQKKLALDSMYKLEHGGADVTRGAAARTDIAATLQQQQARSDDHRLNQLARKRLRDSKAAQLAAESETAAMKVRLSVDIELMPALQQDTSLAQLIRLSSTHSCADDARLERRQQISARPLFAAPTYAAAPPRTLPAAPGLTPPVAPILTPHASPGPTAPTESSKRQTSLDALMSISGAQVKQRRVEAFQPSFSAGVSEGILDSAACLVGVRGAGLALCSGVSVRRSLTERSTSAAALGVRVRRTAAPRDEQVLAAAASVADPIGGRVEQGQEGRLLEQGQESCLLVQEQNKGGALALVACYDTSQSEDSD